MAKPGTPGGFKTRSAGGSLNPGATLNPPKPPVARYVTHIVLYEYRMWSSSDGKPLEAKLIAFEDLVVEAAQGTVPEMPKPPARPTVIRDGKIRLLVKNKPVTVALDRLSESDREFVAAIDAALTKKAAAGK